MKRIHVEDFVRLSERQLRIFGPLPHEMHRGKRCLLTLKDEDEIEHAVWTTDAQVYDAFVLRDWLRTQTRDYSVLPGTRITWIYGYHWLHCLWREYLASTRRTLVDYWLRYHSRRGRTPANALKRGIGIVRVTHTIMRLQLANKCNWRGTISQSLPSASTAFSVIRRPS